jgi:thiol:disulfide interchange protein DsbA
MLSRLLVTAALLLLSPFALAQYEAGRDYFEITPAQPTASGDKIEVVEVFGYPCIHCAHAAPVIREWSHGLGPDVQLTFMPAVFGGAWEAFGRAYYTAETMGLVEKTHDKMFEAVHTEKRQFRNLEDIAAFYAEYGVSKEAFLAGLQSFPVNAKIAQAIEQVQAYGVEGTPTMVVNGKYRVMSPGGENGFEKMLQIVDFLIAKERAAKQPA